MSNTVETAKRTWREASHEAAKLSGRIGLWRFTDAVIAGSVRRRKPLVGDVEIVFRPRPRPELKTDLFDGAVAQRIESNAVWDRLDELVASHPSDVTKAAYPDKCGRVRRRWGPRYRGVAWRGFRYEFYLADLCNFGAQVAIRTGPEAFSRFLMRALRRQGLKMDGGYVRDGATGKVIDCPDEATFFDLAGVPWVEPEARDYAADGGGA